MSLWRLEVIGFPEAIQACRQYGHDIRPVTMKGLEEGVNAVIEQARRNLYSVPPPPMSRYMRTGRLGRSLRILYRNEQNLTVHAGSLLDYAFYQEYGYTSRGGRAIPGKAYFQKAIEMKRPEFLELLRSKIMREVPWRG